MRVAPVVSMAFTFSFTAATKGSGSKVTERSSPKVMCSAISSAVMAIFSAPAMVRESAPPRYLLAASRASTRAGSSRVTVGLASTASESVTFGAKFTVPRVTSSMTTSAKRVLPSSSGTTT